MTQIINTNNGQDFSAVTPVIAVDISGNYTTVGGGGAGTVTGPVSSTDNAVVRWNGTGGTSVQNSSVTIDDNGTITLPSGQSLLIGAGGGLTSAAAGQTISINSSSGISLGNGAGGGTWGGTGDISIAPTGKATLASSSNEVWVTSSQKVLLAGAGDLVVTNPTTRLSGTYVYVDGQILPGSTNAQIGQASPNSFASIYAKNFGTDLVSSGITATGTYDIDLRQGMSINYDFTGCPSGTVTFTLSNPIKGSAYILTTKQNASGTVAVAWPNSIKWQGGVSGTLTTASGTSPIDMFSLYCSNNSPATYLGSFSNNYF